MGICMRVFVCVSRQVKAPSVFLHGSGRTIPPHGPNYCFTTTGGGVFGGEVTYSLAVLLFETDSDWKRASDGHINSVMTRFIVDCRILHGESTPLGPLSRMSDTVIMVKGWTVCWEAEMTHPYSFVPPCVYIKVWKWFSASLTRSHCIQLLPFGVQFWISAHFNPHIKVRTWLCVSLHWIWVCVCFNLKPLCSGMQWKALSSLLGV